MLTEEYWSTLIDQIAAQACTPILGAGACWGLLPLGADLAAALAARHQFPLQHESNNLEKVAQYIAVKSRTSNQPKNEIASELSGRLATGNLPADNIHRVLAEAELPIYLTTNYDDLMLRALREHRRRDGTDVVPRQEVCRWNHLLLSTIPSTFDNGEYQPSPARPVVFHLHGSLDRDLRSSMVATEDDYLDFLINVSKDLASSPLTDGALRKAALPPRIRSAIQCASLLFIGYSLSDINFKVILRTLVASMGKANRHLSVTLQLAPTADRYADPDAVRDYFVKYFDWTFDLQVMFGTADAFAAELRARLRARRVGQS